MSNSNAAESVQVDAGRIHYRESGSGPAIVFAHGLLVNGLLWRKVTPLLEDRFRCVVPDLPLGSHSEAMRPDADMTPPGVARTLADFMAALDLRDVTLVGNDTGGAISQLVAANHPERLGRLVLTPCDAYENFLPPFFRPLQYAAKVPGLLTALVQPTRVRALQRGPLAFGLLISPENIDPEVLDAWVRPFLDDRGVRRDAIRFLRSISSRYTLEAAEALKGFDRPTLIAWAPEDRFFKFKYAQRLASEMPNARLVTIEDSRTFVSEDQPQRLAEDRVVRLRDDRRVTLGDPDHPVRRAGAGDAELIGRLLHDFNTEFEEITPGPRAIADRMRELLAGDDLIVLLAGAEAAGLAVLRFRPSIWTRGLECYLAELYVQPEHRGRGLGRALMAATLEAARAEGADYVEVATSEDDMAARALYEQFGFINRERGADGPLMYVYEREL